MRLLLLAVTGVCVLAAADGDWPQWRGPADDGMARGDAPLEWSDTKNIAWKANVPGRGHSSPVVWGNRIFLTTAVPKSAPPAPPAEEAGRGGRKGGGRGAFGSEGPQADHDLQVMAFQRSDGKHLWTTVVKTVAPHEGYHGQYGSFASNSPVTDGKLLYSFFGSHGVYALNLSDGKIVWSKDAGVKMRMRNAFGEGTAAVLEGDTLLLNFDHEDSSDFLWALDKNTGATKWKTARDEISNWAAPLVVDFEGKKQIIVSAPGKVRGYDFATGKPIWECGGLGANTIPAPVYADGIVYVMVGFRVKNLMAIKLGREGDLTGTDAVVWSTDRGTSYTASPVLHDGKIYFLTDSGMLSCLDAKTGKPYYQQQRLPKPYSFKSSPVGVNGKLYLASENDDVVVVKMGETFEVLATNTLTDQMFIATPAVVDGDIYLRGQNTLFCVRQPRK